MYKPCVVIPVYNHEHAIHTVVSRIHAQGYDCILVNDGSSAECTAVLRQLPTQFTHVFLVEHTINQGKGAATKTALAEAAKRGYSHALQIDADGQHNFDDIGTFFALSRQHPQAIINGNAVYDESVPKHRLYGRYITHFLVWIHTLSFHSIKDSMCGFRIYPLATILPVITQFHVGNRMDFDTEILVRSYWFGIPIMELPTKVHYPLDGVSHFKMLTDNLMMARLHVRLFGFMLLKLPRYLLHKVRQ